MAVVSRSDCEAEKRLTAQQVELFKGMQIPFDARFIGESYDIDSEDAPTRLEEDVSSEQLHAKVRQVGMSKLDSRSKSSSHNSDVWSLRMQEGWNKVGHPNNGISNLSLAIDRNDVLQRCVAPINRTWS